MIAKIITFHLVLLNIVLNLGIVGFPALNLEVWFVFSGARYDTA